MVKRVEMILAFLAFCIFLYFGVKWQVYTGWVEPDPVRVGDFIIVVILGVFFGAVLLLALFAGLRFNRRLEKRDAAIAYGLSETEADDDGESGMEMLERNGKI